METHVTMYYCDACSEGEQELTEKPHFTFCGLHFCKQHTEELQELLQPKKSAQQAPQKKQKESQTEAKQEKQTYHMGAEAATVMKTRGGLSKKEYVWPIVQQMVQNGTRRVQQIHKGLKENDYFISLPSLYKYLKDEGYTISKGFVVLDDTQRKEEAADTSTKDVSKGNKAELLKPNLHTWINYQNITNVKTLHNSLQDIGFTHSITTTYNALRKLGYRINNGHVVKDIKEQDTTEKAPGLAFTKKEALALSTPQHGKTQIFDNIDTYRKQCPCGDIVPRNQVFQHMQTCKEASRVLREGEKMRCPHCNKSYYKVISSYVTDDWFVRIYRCRSCEKEFRSPPYYHRAAL